MTVDGEEREMTRGELMVYVRHHDPELRGAAYQELYRVYGSDGPILGQIYQTLVRDWRNEQLALRKFAAPISARNLANDIPDAVVDTLLAVSQRNAGIFQRFFRLKARLLGIEKLRRYDVYAPVVKSDKKYAFDEAVNMVLDSFHEFDPRVADLARRVFAEKHIDSEVRKGKRGGAFCASTVPDIDALGAAQLPGAGRRRGHDGARAGPCHPRDAGPDHTPLYLPFHPAAGRDRFDLRRNDAGRPPAARRKATKPCAATCSSAR